MQSDEVDILGAITGVLKTLKDTDKLASKPLEEWPTYSNTLKKCTGEDDGSTVYQLQKLKRFDEGKAYYASHYQDYCHRVNEDKAVLEQCSANAGYHYLSQLTWLGENLGR